LQQNKRSLQRSGRFTVQEAGEERAVNILMHKVVRGGVAEVESDPLPMRYIHELRIGGELLGQVVEWVGLRERAEKERQENLHEC
jgi:hypothetical protein